MVIEFSECSIVFVDEGEFVYLISTSSRIFIYELFEVLFE